VRPAAAPPRFDDEAEVVVIAAFAAREAGASVIVVEAEAHYRRSCHLQRRQSVVRRRCRQRYYGFVENGVDADFDKRKPH